jgi:hypothetical protein
MIVEVCVLVKVVVESLNIDVSTTASPLMLDVEPVGSAEIGLARLPSPEEVAGGSTPELVLTTELGLVEVEANGLSP